MNKLNKPLRTVVSAAIWGVIATSAAHAGAFSLYTESSAVALGNYAAGAAAEANDASTGWYNPAGLVLIKDQQAIFGGAGVFPVAKLNGTSTFTTTSLPNYPQTFSGTSGGENGFVPSFHYALPLGDKAAFGFSVVAPFGLSTDWGVNSPVRYEATLSELLTANFAPELAAYLTDNFSFGAGLDLQYAKVKFNRMIGVPTLLTILNPANPAADDTLTYNRGTSFGVGYHLGVMGMFNDKHTRVGLNYQSRVKHKFNGYSQLSGPLASTGNLFGTPILPASVRRNNNLSSNDIEMPGVLTLSAYHDLNDTFALLGSVVYTDWTAFNTIQLNGVAAPSIAADGTVTQVTINSTSPQNYNGAWRAALGVNYKVNDLWKVRVGGGYDQTPTNNIDRDVRLPDVDRWALSIGAHYQMKPTVGFDAGYTHLFAVNNPTMNRTDALSPTSTYNVLATGGSVSADLVGLQVVWTMDQPEVAATK